MICNAIDWWPYCLAHVAGLLLSRAFVGLGEGIAPSAATDMVARIGNENERSRSMSFIYSGLHVGSLLGLLVAPQLIDHFGWQTVGAPSPDQMASCCT